MTHVINLFGGPGAGKSTIAAGVFHALKVKGINCELVTEYAKDMVWKESFTSLDNQLHVFAMQHDKFYHLLGKVDVIITDSPLLNSIVYGTDNSDEFNSLIASEHHKMDNLNIVLERPDSYQQEGRRQDHEGAKFIDGMVNDVLLCYDCINATIKTDEKSVESIIRIYENSLKAFAALDAMESKSEKC